jgi:hypothetical protein
MHPLSSCLDLTNPLVLKCAICLLPAPLRDAPRTIEPAVIGISRLLCPGTPTYDILTHHLDPRYTVYSRDPIPLLRSCLPDPPLSAYYTVHSCDPILLL